MCLVQVTCSPLQPCGILLVRISYFRSQFFLIVVKWVFVLRSSWLRAEAERSRACTSATHVKLYLLPIGL